MSEIKNYLNELNELSDPNLIESLYKDLAARERDADIQEKLIKVSLASICDRLRIEKMPSTFAEKTAAADPSYQEQIIKSADANLAARMIKAKLEAILIRVKSLHTMVSAEKTLTNFQ